MKKNYKNIQHHSIRTGLTTAVFLILLLLTGYPIPVSAHDSSGEPYVAEAWDQLEKFLTEMIGLIKETKGAVSLEEREKRLYTRAMENFDFRTFSQLSLGRKYRSFSEQQQKEFTHYFSRLISKTYVARLQGQNIENISIEYDEARSLEPKNGILRVDAATRLIQSGTPIPIVYRLIRREGSDWKIYDVQIEGVSMAANYRDQFREAVSDSPEKIITDLKEKVQE